MDYNYELAQKQTLVVEIFRQHNIEIEPPEIITDGRDYHYRNKMEYALYWNNQTNQIDLAFHQRGSHRKVPIIKSSIERPEIFQRATEIIRSLNARGEEARRYQSLLLRCNQDGVVEGGLYENKKPHPTFPPLTDTILGHTYSYSPNGFFQINLPVYELALEEIQKHITTDHVLDLYAGVGTIGLSIAKGHKLTLVECDKLAYEEMVKNIDLFVKSPNDTFARIEQTRVKSEEASRGEYGTVIPAQPRLADEDFTRRVATKRAKGLLGVLAKSEEVLRYINPDQTVILDPPRAGCDRRLIDGLLAVKPAKIIYLSCNPATQARDISLLLAKYHLDKVKTFNFFPHTPHIENLAILS